MLQTVRSSSPSPPSPLLVSAAPAGTTRAADDPASGRVPPRGHRERAGLSFFVGSIPQGSVYRGSYRTGEGEVLVPAHEGRNHTGLKVDARPTDCSSPAARSKGIYVYDSRTGADVESFALADAGFVNDVVLTRRAAYFTDSQVQQLYRVGICKHGSIGELSRIPISGDFAVRRRASTPTGSRRCPAGAR